MSRGRDERRQLESPKPRDAPGFREASDNGLAPLVPIDPLNGPAPGLNPPASSLMRRFVARAVATGAASIGFLFGITPRIDIALGLDATDFR